MKYIYDYSKLLGRLREMGLTQSDLAGKIGISEASLNLKLKNKSPFKQCEISEISEVLSIPNAKIETYFFIR